MEMPNRSLFRATLEAWLGQMLLPLVFFLVLILTVMARIDLPVWVGGLGLGLLVVVVTVQYGMPMLRHWLRVDERSLEGFYRGQYFEIFWGEVLAAWIWENHRQPFLCLGTRQGTFILPLRFFDVCAVWEQVQKHVPPAALEADAMLHLPDFQRWQAIVPEVSARGAAVTDHWIVQMIGWAGLTSALFITAEKLLEGAWLWMGVCLLLTGLFTWWLARWGITELNNGGVERHTLFCVWHINWDAIRWVEMDPWEGTLVLAGDDRCLVLPGPLFWSLGDCKQAALAQLMNNLTARHIPIRRTPLALIRRSSRNCRGRARE